jgi:hypothetical protein
VSWSDVLVCPWCVREWGRRKIYVAVSDTADLTCFSALLGLPGQKENHPWETADHLTAPLVYTAISERIGVKRR